MSLITSEQKNALEMHSSSGFVPSIKITYALSQHFKDGKAKLGDFYLDETSLGGSIEATALNWRYQFVAIQQGEFVESLVVPNTIDLNNLWEDERVKAFKEKNSKCDINHGIDILLYLPKQDSFGVLFCSKKLAKAAFPILENADDGKIVKISTVKKEYKKFEWYELEVASTGGSVNVPSPGAKTEVYLSQIVEEVEDDGRER